MKKVAVIMGSDSNLPVVQKCLNRLKKFGIPFEAHVFSAHRRARRKICVLRQGQRLRRRRRRRRKSPPPRRRNRRVHHPPRNRNAQINPRQWTVSTPSSRWFRCPAASPSPRSPSTERQNAAILAAQILALSDDTLAAKLDDFKKDMESRRSERQEATGDTQRVNARPPCQSLLRKRSKQTDLKGIKNAGQQTL